MDPVNVSGNANRNRNQTRRVNRETIAVKTIRNYIILSFSIQNDLIQEVNNKIKQGYIPQGGVAFQFSGGVGSYKQAMIKY